MPQVVVGLKLVLDFTTRNQTGPSQIRNWFGPVEGWSLNAVNDLIASYSGVATLLTTDYDLMIGNRGVSSAGSDDRTWQVYPGRIVKAEVDDKTAFTLHFDTYMDDLRALIETFLETNRVTHRITVQSWHLHYAAGAQDVVL